MMLSPKLTALLYNKHSLENGLSNSLDSEPKDAFDIIYSYKIKIATMKELIRTYEDILQYYIENPDVLTALVNTTTHNTEVENEY